MVVFPTPPLALATVIVSGRLRFSLDCIKIPPTLCVNVQMCKCANV